MEKYDNETKKIDKIKYDNDNKKTKIKTGAIIYDDDEYVNRLNSLYPNLQKRLSGVSMYKIKESLIDLKGEGTIIKLLKDYHWVGKITEDSRLDTLFLLRIAEKLNKEQMESFVNGLIIHADENQNIDTISHKLQHLIYILPIKNIQYVLRLLKFKGSMQINKVLLNLQLAQHFNTMDKMKSLTNRLEIAHDTLRQEADNTRYLDAYNL